MSLWIYLGGELQPQSVRFNKSSSQHTNSCCLAAFSKVFFSISFIEPIRVFRNYNGLSTSFVSWGFVLYVRERGQVTSWVSWVSGSLLIMVCWVLAHVLCRASFLLLVLSDFLINKVIMLSVNAKPYTFPESLRKSSIIFKAGMLCNFEDAMTTFNWNGLEYRFHSTFSPHSFLFPAGWKPVILWNATKCTYNLEIKAWAKNDYKFLYSQLMMGVLLWMTTMTH